MALRLLLASTPRSGNTWLRRLMADSLGLQEYAVHHPRDLEWCSLPERCIVQLHWLPTAEFTTTLTANGIRVLVILRDPLDVLLSILHFCNFEPQTKCWLDGAGGDERALLAVGPCSDEFVRYATSQRAAKLLAVGPAWLARSGDPAVYVTRYEDLVHDPVGQVSHLIGSLGEAIDQRVDQAVENNSMDCLRQTSDNQHCWLGDPGSSMSMIIPEFADAIRQCHQSLFESTGYTAASDRELTRVEAESTWRALNRLG